MHFLYEIIIAGIVLALFGPKMLQSVSHTAGKGVGKAKQVKEDILADMPVEELNKVREHISRVPLSPQQAVQMLITPAEEKNSKKSTTVPASSTTALPEVAVPSQETRAEYN